jgi:hypothetical protein
MRTRMRNGGSDADWCGSRNPVVGKSRRGASKAEGKGCSCLGHSRPSVGWNDLYVSVHQRQSLKHCCIGLTLHCCIYLRLQVSVIHPLQGARPGMLRRYATVASKPPSRLRARGKSPVGLDHVCTSNAHSTPAQLTVVQFIQRQRALVLWREIVRSTANIPDKGARQDMRQFAKSEFEQHRNVTDLVCDHCPQES